MSYIVDFVVDNLGDPETYTVMTPCRRVRFREKDRTVTTQASYNVYFPWFGNNTPNPPRPCEPGEEFIFDPQRTIWPGEKIKLETLNVAAATFSIIEEG